jgi:hypothetical protein
VPEPSVVERLRFLLPTVSQSNLIVGHISIETFNIDYVPGMLRKMNIPFRQNVSVPKGPDAGKWTNSDKSNSKIVEQYFRRDPEGYYLEVCNCDVFTKFCLGEKIDLDSYEEGAPPLSLEDACKVIGIMQKWSQTGNQAKEAREDLIPRAMETDHSNQALAALFRCTPAAFADEELLAALVTRMSVYGDIVQNETKESLREILTLSGNSLPMATRFMKIRADVEGVRRVQAPAFYENGETLTKPPENKATDDL